MWWWSFQRRKWLLYWVSAASFCRRGHFGILLVVVVVGDTDVVVVVVGETDVVAVPRLIPCFQGGLGQGSLVVVGDTDVVVVVVEEIEVVAAPC